MLEMTVVLPAAMLEMTVVLTAAALEMTVEAGCSFCYTFLRDLSEDCQKSHEICGLIA